MANVFWITGLSSAGKTTLPKLLTDNLRSKNLSVVMLDGDELRSALKIDSNFTGDERLDLAFKYSRLSKLISSQGVNVVVGTIALFKEIHLWNRKNIPGYFEIYLRVPLSERRRRDPKEIYKRYYSGELQNVAGLDLAIDEPTNPDLVIDFSKGLTPEKSLKMVINNFNNKLNKG